MDPIRRLVVELGRLPGIGERTATRLAFHVLRAPDKQVRDLASALVEVRERIRPCQVCCNLTDQPECGICRDTRRDAGLICVVAHPTDVLAIERPGTFRGTYHVLHGLLSPLDGVGPDDLRIAELLARLGGASGASLEVILATPPNVEGEATAMYLVRLLSPHGVRLSRIASGVPIGGELEYVDGVTLSRALTERKQLGES